MTGGIHHNYARVLEAMHDESSWECIRYLQRGMAEALFPVADDRYRTPGEEAIRDAIDIHPGADRGLVRAYFAFRPSAEFK